MTDTGRPRANGGQLAPMPAPGELASGTLSQALRVMRPRPSSVPSEEGLGQPGPAAALIDTALLIGPLLVMGGTAGASATTSLRRASASGGAGQLPAARLG